MAPPSYADLGKQARDLLSKGYNFGSWKVEAKSTTDSGVKFKTNGTHNTESGKALGEFEGEYGFKDYGLKVVEKWNTDNTMAVDFSFEDQLVEGSKFTLSTQYNPSSGKKSGALKSSFKADSVNLNLDGVYDYNGPLMRGSGVFAYSGFLAGYLAAFDISKSKLSQNNISLGYQGKDFTLNANCNDLQDFGSSVWHKVNASTEAGAQVGWNQSTGQTSMCVGTKYAVSPETTLRARVNLQTQVGLSLEKKLSDDVSMTLSTLVDAKNFNTGGHRLGVSFNFGQ